MLCAMCKNPADYLINETLTLCGECFDPSDPDVVQLDADGPVWEELPAGDPQGAYDGDER